LQIKPELEVGVEVAGEAKGGVRADTAAFVEDLRNARGGDVEIERQLVCRKAQRLHEILAKDFARVNGRHQGFALAHGKSLLVIVDDFNSVCVAVKRLEPSGRVAITKEFGG
jgi:hypothetical protein